ncbi:MAG: ABC transporter permease [Actinomycetota bacterium]
MDNVLTFDTLTAALRLAIPVAVAALGALIAERSGVLNLGLEGMMLSGAFAAYTTAEVTGSPWLGLVGGAVVGGAVALLLAVFVVVGRANQIVTGISFTLLAGFATALLFQQQYSIGGIPPRIERIELPALVALTVAGFAGVAWFLRRTTAGLALTAAGEAPESVDALGYRVGQIRTVATTLSGAFAGLGGAMLVCGPLGLFIENVTAGRGWVALAIVVFAGWRPTLVLVGAFLFGLADAVQLRLQGTDTAIPYEVFLALPYIVTLIALVVRARASRTPAALGVPFVRGAV